MTSKLKVFALAALALAATFHSAHAQPTNADATVYLFSTFKEPEQDGITGIRFSHESAKVGRYEPGRHKLELIGKGSFVVLGVVPQSAELKQQDAGIGIK